MLAPIDKINRRGGNDICQIVITRSCDIFNCSNCTQLLPFRKDPREMSLHCIEEALISMEGWPGIVACFGGNPCTHSKFPEVCELWKQYIPRPQRGLWTNNLLKYGKEVRDTFYGGRFNLNVHGDQQAAEEMQKWLPNVPVYGREAIHHGGVLGSHAELGVSEEDWVQQRERCDINQRWSAGIYEREGRPYAYFCEVAGSIDGTIGENNGILAEKGWWRWPMERFQSQVGACCDKHCLVPLRLKGHLDSEAVYDLTPNTATMVGEPMAKGGKDVITMVHQNLPSTTYELTDYAGLRKPR